MRRIRVVFSIGAMHGGGSERQMILLLRHLDRTLFEPHLYLVYKSGPLLDQVPTDVPVVSFDTRVTPSRIYLPGLMHSRRVRDYARYLQEVQADVSYDRTFLMTLISAAGAQRAGVPNVSTIVTNPETGFAPVAGRFQRFKKRILHRLYNNSAQVLAVSDGAREAAIRFYGIQPDRIATLLNGVDVDWIQQQATLPIADSWWTGEKNTLVPRQPCIDGLGGRGWTEQSEGSPGVSGCRPPTPATHQSMADKAPAASRVFRIVTAGRLNHQKGFHILIAAMNQVREKVPDVEFRVAILGAGPDHAALQQQIFDLKLQDTVHLTGFQDNAIAWYRSADVFVLPSLIEGMPNVLLEAMACGTAVISTDCKSGPSEILNNGQYGTLVSTNDVAELRDALINSLNSSEHARIAELAQAHVAEHWSAKAAAERLGIVLKKVHADRKLDQT